MKVTLPAASQEDSSPAGQLLDVRNGNSGWELRSCSAQLLPAPISSSAGCPGRHGWHFQHCWARSGVPAARSQAAAARQQLLHSSDVAGQQQLGQRHSHACKTCFQNTKHVEEFPFRIKPIVREKDRGHSVIVSWSISCLGSCCTPRQSLAKVPAAPWSTAATSSCRAPGLAHDAPAKPQCSRRRLSLPGALCRKAETSGSAVPLKLQTFQLERNNGEK